MRASPDLGAMRASGLARLRGDRPFVSVGLGTCGLGNGAGELFAALEREVEGGGVGLRRVGCFGFCAAEPLAMVHRPGRPLLLVTEAKAAQAARLVEAAASDEAHERLSRRAAGKIEAWDFRTARLEYGEGYPSLHRWDELPFFAGQVKLVLRDAGMIDPESLEEYLAVGGYGALMKALGTMRPEAVIAEMKASGLRGRGGAGFPTWRKWELLRQSVPGAGAGTVKYLVCNADEGDPGAYMNRNEIESDPHALLEGMVLGAYATGASQGLVYVRAEYPLAVERLGKAVEAARAAGLLGKDILGSRFSFDLEVVTGAGAFVCGEETALLASAEGKAGRPTPRPPFPAQRGFRGAPTNINNVETYCNVPLVVARGGAWFAGFGTPTSSGTKVFSLVGKARNTGLVELPLGTPLEAMVYGMGGGAGPNKRVKALQSGGPSGGCVPASLFKTPIDYERLAELGAIMGSGGMVVMDEDNCMVDVARYFVGFTAGESCGKCVPCREGLGQMLRVLERVSRGEAAAAELDLLEELALAIRDSALCGLGQTAANPVLTTLRYFRAEYERHAEEGRCAAGTCGSLYLALCENSCPLHMNIPGYLQLIKEDRLEEAFELTLRENPLPGSLGRICHFHCRTRCKREELDEPVSQGQIHRYLADAMYKMGREKAVYARLRKEALPPTGKVVSIVGAGPAGLAAAFWLVRLGHEVTLYDAAPEAGGIPRWGIPAYRLPPEVLAKEVAALKALGVRMVLSTRVGRDLPWERLADMSDALLVCVGALEDARLGIPGEGLPGVLPGCAFLERVARGERPEIGRRVVVVGGGNSAVDAARTARRLGAEVTIVYRRAKSDMPANAEELAGADEEEVRILALSRPEEILAGAEGRVRALKVMRMKAGPIDASGRPAPVPTGQLHEIACDTVVVAVGERVDASGIGALGVELERDGRIKAEPKGLRTAHPKVWAAGDAVSGPATASEAMGLARRAAESLDRVLMAGSPGAEGRFGALFRRFEYGMEVPEEAGREKAARAPRLAPIERTGNFLEIAKGLSGEEARAEAGRCLRCELRVGAPRARSGPAPAGGDGGGDGGKRGAAAKGGRP